MIHLRYPQGSPAWLAARLGVPTASCFHRIITPKTRKPSAQAGPYAEKLLSEWLTGASMDEPVSQFMDRGRELEPDARDWYAWQTNVNVDEAGFCLSDDGAHGASPDGFVGQDGIIEIKCYELSHHVAELLNPTKDTHSCQIQGQLWVTGRAWCDKLLFNPQIPPILTRIERDEAFIELLADAVDRFVERMTQSKEKLIDTGCHPKLKPFTEGDWCAHTGQKEYACRCEACEGAWNKYKEAATA